MLLAICEKKLAIFASIGNYFRPCWVVWQHGVTASSGTVHARTASRPSAGHGQQQQQQVLAVTWRRRVNATSKLTVNRWRWKIEQLVWVTTAARDACAARRSADINRATNRRVPGPRREARGHILLYVCLSIRFRHVVFQCMTLASGVIEDNWIIFDHLQEMTHQVQITKLRKVYYCWDCQWIFLSRCRDTHTGE